MTDDVNYIGIFYSFLTGVIRNFSACFSKFCVFIRNWPACFEKASFLYAGSYCNTTFFLLTRFDSKFDMREAYCWRGIKNLRSSRIEKEWLGNVPLSLKIFNDQIVEPLLQILSCLEYQILCPLLFKL